MPPSNKFCIVEDCAPKQARYIQLTILFTVLISLAMVYLTPYKHLFALFHIESSNGCPLLTFTGIPCPMCGMGRVFSGIIMFKISNTFYFNPLGLVAYVFMGSIIFPAAYLSFKYKRIKLTQRSHRFWYIPVIFILIMWVLNILYGHH